jgi:hypothetical protein
MKTDSPKKGGQMASEQEKRSYELHIESGQVGKEGAVLTIFGVPGDLTSEDKIHKLLDLLQMPKGTKVTVSTKASSSIVR